ncbi:MAG: TIGR01440 family protein [Clostridia bacterium]|nr:TIGR01440 family protein [Clostridia bacterium]
MSQNNYGEAAAKALLALLATSKPKEEQIVVVGCSSSEIAGGRIGKASNAEIGKEVAAALLKITDKNHLYLAAQCCEHLNRALVVEAVCAEKYGLTVVSAVPHPKAGGSFASAVYQMLYERMEEPVLVEEIHGHFGLDIGQTMIGMHLQRVAVPVRVEPAKVGEAIVTAARVRPKLIGGERALYAMPETSGI